MTDIVITAAKRTAIGKFMGSLSGYSAPELGKLVIEAVLNENNLDKNLIDELIMGQVPHRWFWSKPQQDKVHLSRSTY